MLDQLYGKPSSSWKRTQVFLVLLFWSSRIVAGNPKGPRLFFLRRLNRFLSRFTPWQIILSTFTIIYGIKHSDAILGLQAPEPLARLYSRNYYRATWIATAFDAGFATAMPIKRKWLRDLLSVAFSGYYLFFANEADEKLRKYRAVCTVEMLRTTWEKTSNPYLRLFTSGDRPKIRIKRRVLLPRPKGSTYTKPITVWMYFDGSELELSQQTELIFDIPGGGFICMSPEHHEERTIRWTIRTGRPVIGFDYGKAPEYPFPFAIDEMYDAYKLLYETNGKSIGMSGTSLRIVVTGDSAGANIGTAMVVKILETKPRLLPLPVGLVFAYPALSFHFTSWMPSQDLKVLRQESHSNIAGILRGKDHLEHRSPLSVVEDVPERPRFRRRRTSSWGTSFSRAGDDGDDEDEHLPREDKDKSLEERIVFWEASNDVKQAELQVQADTVGKRVMADNARAPKETRLAMTSRSAFFNDRIISPSMCRAMALLYIGPRDAPDLHTDYHISPIFTPLPLLAQFPPVFVSCGERDPFVDDTVIFAGRLREAKEARKLELLGRQSKFGESLRMSASASSGTRDPILDENEENWCQMKIIEGWSHGYMQMVTLLPEAVHAINMNADWIVQAFENSAPRLKPVAATHLAVPGSRLAVVSSSRNSSPGPGTTSESDKDDEVLSFTARKRRTGSTNSRNESPAPSGGPPSPSRYDSSRRFPASVSSSDDAISNSTPRTPSESHLSPPLPASKAHGHPSPDGAALPPPHLPLIAPHERALRDELHSVQFQRREGSGASLNRRVTSPQFADSSMSDDESLLGPGRIPTIKTSRSGSAGSLPTPLPANFVDAKDLLRRRREEAVFGMSANSSAQPSDDEERD